MYQCVRATKYLVPCSQVLLRGFSTPPREEVVMPHYRDRADRFNNPYRDLYPQNRGKKPATFRERFVEAKRNEPKPRIGVGDDPKNFLNLQRRTAHRKGAFYRDGGRVTFSDLGLMPELGAQIAELGVVYPTHHQGDVIPVLLENKNCVFISPTGSGILTAGFTLCFHGRITVTSSFHFLTEP